MNKNTTLTGQTSPRRRVEEYVKRQIETGELKAGDTLKSTPQLEKELGISLPTVHLALKSLANAGWLSRERGKRTLVLGNPELKLQKNTKVCFLYGDYTSNRFRSNCVEAIANYASNHNVTLRLECFEKLIAQDIEHFSEILDDYFANLVKQGITHLIREPQTRVQETECWRLIEKYGIKSVSFNDFWLDGGPYSSVRVDDAYGIFMLTNHLISLGHTKILLIDELEYWQRSNAISGFQKAMLCHQLPIFDDMIVFTSSRKHWHALDRGLVEKIIQNYTAVICIYDVYAMRLMSYFQEIGGAAQNISVAIFDWIANGEKNEITTLNQPIDLLIQKTFDILLDNNPQITKLILPPEIKVGNSTKPPVPGK